MPKETKEKIIEILKRRYYDNEVLANQLLELFEEEKQKLVGEILPERKPRTTIGYSNPTEETIKDVERINLIDEGFNQCLEEIIQRIKK